MTTCPVQNKLYCIFRYMLLLFLKLFFDKTCINIPVYFIQRVQRCTFIKWTLFIRKHLCHHMLPAAREYELHICQWLYIGS